MAQNKLTKAIRRTMADGGAGALSEALSGFSIEELEELRAETGYALEDVRRARSEEDSEHRQALREIARIGEALVWEPINCGNCPKCSEGYSVRPHGPYPYLWEWGQGGKITKKYIKKSAVESVEKRIAAKREKSEKARAELRRSRRSTVDPEAVSEIGRINVPGEVTQDKRAELDRIAEADKERERKSERQQEAARQDEGEATSTG